MDRSQATKTYLEETNKLRLKLSRLEVKSIEEKASGEVLKWRRNFDTSSSIQLERVFNEIEKRKQEEVIALVNELRIALDEFKETSLRRLAELDGFISEKSLNDEGQVNYVKFELDSMDKKIECLQMNIIVKVVDTSRQRRSSTALTRNTLELNKVFDFNKPPSNSDSSTGFFQAIRNFFNRASSAGASYYNIDLPE
ncbi:unnamed protein product [Rotaria socialis]|uniref:Uncharacterized protein n=1 Tax=Rotaria socialis TaxID=392032 RepID=A0A817YHN3_9BILA|nr:unnamed protein product [Rotaria socialis]CAF3380507.1 unnamed protein product [Rotaria socialis]CAF3387712.1 unnamed protein product [Rotaria socialis]CAF4400662.1 unnamed protein product [Rotaria socialis]CAF4514419.1 unnamed protein product [Rotaria socialis]